MNGCDFCNDLRNITPAKFLGGSDEEFKEWIRMAKEQKKFILELENEFVIVDKCPKCGHEFTEEDYDDFGGDGKIK